MATRVIGKKTDENHFPYHLMYFFWAEIVGRILSETEDGLQKGSRTSSVFNVLLMKAFLVKRTSPLPDVENGLIADRSGDVFPVDRESGVWTQAEKTPVKGYVMSAWLARLLDIRFPLADLRRFPIHNLTLLSRISTPARR